MGDFPTVVKLMCAILFGVVQSWCNVAILEIICLVLTVLVTSLLSTVSNTILVGPRKEKEKYKDTEKLKKNYYTLYIIQEKLLYILYIVSTHRCVL